MQAVGGTRVVACHRRNLPDFHVLFSLFLQIFRLFFWYQTHKTPNIMTASELLLRMRQEYYFLF
jgi:hypothetical protein